jgi:hypothetical protein
LRVGGRLSYMGCWYTEGLMHRCDGVQSNMQ